MASRASSRSDSTRTPWSRSVNAPPNPDDTAPGERQGFWKRFSKTLESGRQSYVADLKEVFGRAALDDTFWDDLDATLIAADAGVPCRRPPVPEPRPGAADGRAATWAQPRGSAGRHPRGWRQRLGQDDDDREAGLPAAAGRAGP